MTEQTKQLTPMQELIDDLKSFESMSILPQDIKTGIAIAIEQAEKKLPKERQAIIDAFNSGYRDGEIDGKDTPTNNLDVSQCSNATDYFIQTYKQP